MVKSGIVTIVGRSNVGKSTLLNTIVGTKVAITTPRAQTTRKPIQGVITRPEGQIVFVDTPGVMQKHNDQLTKQLLEYVSQSLKDINAIVYVVDPTRAMGDEEKQALKFIENSTVPKLLVINKMDDKASKNFIGYYRDLATKFDAYAEVSALTGKDVDRIVTWLFEKMPEDEQYLYPEFQFTNQTNQEWMAELIREKLFLRLHEELPYTTHVEVNEITERPNGTVYVNATVFTNDERYKRMIIGAGGRGIKEIGESTRNELEAVTDRKYYLELRVEVDKHWMARFD